MSIAPTLQKYLASEDIEYDVIAHRPTMSSSDTAQACHISGDRLAKGVVLRRGGGGYVLAIIPASHHIRLSALKEYLGGHLQLAAENEIDSLFPDCARGAIPAIAQCYGLPLVIDDSVTAQPEIYVEAGDHETLVHMDNLQFLQLTAHAQHGDFSEKTKHRAGPSVVWG